MKRFPILAVFFTFLLSATCLAGQYPTSSKEVHDTVKPCTVNNQMAKTGTLFCFRGPWGHSPGTEMGLESLYRLHSYCYEKGCATYLEIGTATQAKYQAVAARSGLMNQPDFATLKNDCSKGVCVGIHSVNLPEKEYRAMLDQGLTMQLYTQDMTTIGTKINRINIYEPHVPAWYGKGYMAKVNGHMFKHWQDTGQIK